MTHHELTPREKERAVLKLRGRLDGLEGDRILTASEHAFLSAELRSLARAMATGEVELELYSDGMRLQCRANGQHIPFRGKGLALVWLIFAGIQYRLEPVRPDQVFPGKRWRASTVQACDRALEAAARVCPSLAQAIRALGIEGGVLVPKQNAQVRVRVTLAADLQALMLAA